jgi:hypothetical protein
VFVTLNVGGHRFLTTAATLGAQDGSYFAKLAAQAVAAAGKGKSGSEFFVDRSGKVGGQGWWVGAGGLRLGGGGGAARIEFGHQASSAAHTKPD